MQVQLNDIAEDFDPGTHFLAPDEEIITPHGRIVFDIEMIKTAEWSMYKGQWDVRVGGCLDRRLDFGDRNHFADFEEGKAWAESIVAEFAGNFHNPDDEWLENIFDEPGPAQGWAGGQIR